MTLGQLSNLSELQFFIYKTQIMMLTLVTLQSCLKIKELNVTLPYPHPSQQFQFHATTFEYIFYPVSSFLLIQELLPSSDPRRTSNLLIFILPPRWKSSLLSLPILNSMMHHYDHSLLSHLDILTLQNHNPA